MNKPRIGLLLLSAEWLNRIGANKGFYRNLPDRIKRDGETVAQLLSRRLQVVNPGIVNTREKAAGAATLFRKEKIDLLLVCYLTWGEDYLFLKIIRQLPEIPVLLWCYVPSARLPEKFDMAELFPLSGPVAALQASSPLKKSGRNFGFVFGSLENKTAVNYILDYSQAARTAAGLKKARIGLLPSFCDQMSGTRCSPVRLKKELGPEVVTVSVSEYNKAVKNVSEKKVKDYAGWLKENYKVDERVSDAALIKASRVSLGLADVVDKYRLDGLALQDLDEELHRKLGLRPCLAVPALFEKSVVSMEGDVCACLAMLILRRLTGGPVMYTEIFTFDEKKNAILAGHAGMMDDRLAQGKKSVRIVPDYEYFESGEDTAAMLFRAKGGRVTLLNISESAGCFKMVAFSGEALPGKIMLEGSPHIYIKVKVLLKELFTKTVRTGITQHWAVVHEDVTNKLACLAEILGIELLRIE